jgi:sulfite reductase (ferredoxin)
VARFRKRAKSPVCYENEKQIIKRIINLFDTVFIETNKIELQSTLKDLVFQINKEEPSEEFARKYIKEAIAFF